MSDPDPHDQPTTLPAVAEAGLPAIPKINEKLAPHVAAVETARHRLVTDIDKLDSEVRLEVLFRMESFAWRAVAGIATAVAGIAATKVLGKVWGKLILDHEPPENPSDPRTSTKDAVLWTGLTGLGVGVAAVLAQRGAAKGWTKATGRIPPPFEKDVTGKAIPKA